MEKLITITKKERLTNSQRLIDEAPYYSRCSTNKTAANMKPREFAMRYPYMGVNRNDMVSWLVFDIDHDHLAIPNPYIWQDANLPPPNLIVRNRCNNKAHLYYAITPVCVSDKARAKPMQYMKAIYKAMATRLESDEQYSGPMAKTPFHPWWITTELHDQEYSLGELADYVELEQTPPWGQKELADTSHSRHCTLFEHLRYFAYSIVNKERDQGSYKSFKSRVHHYASAKNHFVEQGFDANLPESSIKATVKSVSRWTWDHYTGRSDCNRYVMLLSPTLPLSEKQSLAAKRTHQQRSEKTLQRIFVAVRRMLESKVDISFSAIAKFSQLSRQTIAKYREQIKEILRSPKGIIPLASLFRQKQDVNYAVHQITAPLFDLKGSSLDDVLCVGPIKIARKQKSLPIRRDSNNKDGP